MTGEIKEGPGKWWYIDFNKSFLEYDMQTWLTNNCENDWKFVAYGGISNSTLYFLKYEDAVMFKMVWL